MVFHVVIIVSFLPHRKFDLNVKKSDSDPTSGVFLSVVIVVQTINLFTLVHGVAYQQTGFPLWLMLSIAMLTIRADLSSAFCTWRGEGGLCLQSLGRQYLDIRLEGMSRRQP